MIRNYKIGYIILHYQVLTETCACVKALQKVSATNDVIIIIDNHSPNNSGEKLCRKFQNTSNITVILNSNNMGFARGNNVGYSLAKYKYNCDFIVLLNNDTIIQQPDFRNRILTAYETYHFAVMGPKILYADGRVNPCSPLVPVHTCLHRVKLGQISNLIRYLLSICNLDIWFEQILHYKKSTQTELYQENVQLSGCCLIFSKEYIDKFEGLNPGTFMYLEEAILYVMVKNAGLKIIYNPDLEIVHLEDAATLEAFKRKPRRIRQFKYKCQMHSFKVLLEEIRKQGGEHHG